MKYKFGDKVKIKSINWYNINKQKHGEIEFLDNDTAFVEPMSQYCGKLATITKVNNSTYSINIDSNKFFWTDEMFEDTIDTNIRPIVFELSIDKAKEWYKQGGELKNLALLSFNEKELKEIPKRKYADELKDLQRLLIKRDFVNGDWKPNWTKEKVKFTINNCNNSIRKSIRYESSCILAFPTKEIRDTFLNENKTLINKVKDLI